MEKMVSVAVPVSRVHTGLFRASKPLGITNLTVLKTPIL